MQRRTIAHTAALGLTLIVLSSVALAQYQLTDLVSNEAGKSRHSDSLLVNAWGLTHAPGSPFWISDNGSGWSTLYDADGVKHGLQVKIPAANESGQGTPTGIVFSGTQDFNVQGWPSIFIFATQDGTISGWAPQSNLHNAILAVPNSGSMYTGLAITSRPSGNFLFAADNANNKVDMFDDNFKLVKSFTDTTLPSRFAAFGIQDINGLLYVAFASSSGGPGGYIDVFSEEGGLPETPGARCSVEPALGYGCRSEEFRAT